MSLQRSCSVWFHQWKRWQEAQKSYEMESTEWIWQKLSDLPSATNKESFTLCLCTTNRPSCPSICCLTIHGALINKNKLFCRVYADSVEVCEPLFFRTLNCSAWKLDHQVTMATLPTECFVHTFFIVNPPAHSVRQIVDLETCIPEFASSMSHSSSRYRSGASRIVPNRYWFSC
jgi:hypothetical protein